MLFAVLIGVPAGAIAAVKRGSCYDQTLMGISVTGYLDADLLVGPAADHAGRRAPAA